MAGKILFAGAYGIASQGDDAALEVLFRKLQRHFPNLEGTVLCRHADRNPYARLGLRSLANFEYESKEESTGKWFRGFNYDDDRTLLAAIQQEIDASDLLVLGAGNAFVDYTIDLLRGPIPYLTILTLMAQMVDTPVMWFGISIGPLASQMGRHMTRLSAKLASLVTVRDKNSVQQLRDLGYNGEIIQLPDPVLGLEPAQHSTHSVYRRCHGGGRPVVAVSVRSVTMSMGMEYHAYLNAMASTLDLLVEALGVHFLFIPHGTYEHGDQQQDDRVVARDVVDRMRHRSAAFLIEDQLTVQETLALYRQARSAICTRLHACVFAALQNVPVVAISYNPKVAGFMDSLSCSDNCVDLDALSPAVLVSLVNRIQTNRSEILEIMSQGIAQHRPKVQQYAELAGTFLPG